MKKQLHNLIAASLLTFGSVSIAQPVLTASGINPVVGESYSTNYGAYLSPGSPGASQTWDLSTATGTPFGTSNFANPASTPNGASFTAANVAVNYPSMGLYIYYNASSTVLQSNGSVNSNYVLPYSNPKDELHFPVAYTNTFSDTYAGQYTMQGDITYRKGTTTVTADGWGTLKLPSGNYSNVMRIHVVDSYQDSTFFGTPSVTLSNYDGYYWARNATHTRLAEAYTVTIGSNTSTGINYLTSPVGVNDMSDFLSEYVVSPNPASDFLKLDYTLTENKRSEVKIVNSLGQVVLSRMNDNTVQGLNTMELSVATLSAGIYFAEILLDGNRASTKRFVVSK